MFLEFRRGSRNKLSFQDESAEWHFRLEEAQTKVGLELNDDDAAGSSQPAAASRKLNFPTIIYSDSRNYHTVLSEKRRGLPGDPGVAG